MYLVIAETDYKTTLLRAQGWFQVVSLLKTSIYRPILAALCISASNLSEIEINEKMCKDFI